MLSQLMCRWQVVMRQNLQEDKHSVRDCCVNPHDMIKQIATKHPSDPCGLSSMSQPRHDDQFA